jgi:hypothetical protein
MIIIRIYILNCYSKVYVSACFIGAMDTLRPFFNLRKLYGTCNIYVRWRSDTIGNRSRDLPVCSTVPQPLCHRVPPVPTCSTINYTNKRFHIIANWRAIKWTFVHHACRQQLHSSLDPATFSTDRYTKCTTVTRRRTTSMFPVTLRFCPGDGDRKSVRNFVIVPISTQFCTQKTSGCSLSALSTMDCDTRNKNGSQRTRQSRIISSCKFYPLRSIWKYFLVCHYW